MFKDKEARKSIEELSKKLAEQNSDIDGLRTLILESDSRNGNALEDFKKIIMSRLADFEANIELINQREKLNSDFLKKEISEVVSFNRDLFIKDFLFNTTKDIKKEFDAFKAKILQPLLEAKWEYEKAKQGSAVISRGAEIIEERNKLYEDILTKERSGKDVEKEKIQLATIDKIIKEARK